MTMKRNSWSIVLCFAAPYYLSAQQHASIRDFEFLVEKIRNDYPGYEAKVTPALFALEDRIRHKLELHPDSSFYYFSEYTSYFRDGHLRMGWLFGSAERVGDDSRSSYRQGFPAAEEPRFSELGRALGVEFRGRDRHTEVRSRYEFLRWSVFV